MVLNKDVAHDKSELVFAITRHPFLGYLIEGFAVARTKSNQFEYGFKKVTIHTLQDYFDDLSEEYRGLMEMLHKIADENLHKRFASRSVRVSMFYETLEPEYIARHVRPFIEKVLYSCVGYIADNSIPLYYKGESGERIRETPIKVGTEFAETCFHFERKEDSTHYRLEVQYGGDDVHLYGRKAALITHLPCILLLGRNLLRFEPEWDGKKLQPFFEKEFLHIPKTSEKQFFQKFVQKSILHHPFKAIGFDVNIIDGNPLPILKMEEHWQGSVVLGLYFRYADNTVFRLDEPAKEKIKFLDKEDIAFEKVVRQFSFEREMSEFLKKLHLNKIDGPYYTLFAPSGNALNTITYNIDQQVSDTIDWFNNHHEILSQKGIKCERVIFDKNYHSGVYSLNLKTEGRNDWFDLYGSVTFGEFQVPFAYLTDCILSGNREYILPDKSIALIPIEWMSRYQDIMKFCQVKGEKLQLKKHHFPLLKQLDDKGISLPEINMATAAMKFRVPDELKISLRDYQYEGYNWLMFLKSNGLGGCLADDMGLGKTIQALAILLESHKNDIKDTSSGNPVSASVQAAMMNSSQLNLFDAFNDPLDDVKGSNCSLIVMPLSLIHNWLEEINKFAPMLQVYQHTGNNRDTHTLRFDQFHIVLTTYGTIRNDIEMLEKYKFRYIILDESQIIKNSSSQIFSAIKRMRSEYRLVLTGTPIGNSLTDLWSQFSFINPGMLGSLNFFKKEFVSPIEKRNNEIAGSKLQKLVEPFILRRTKDQVARELPPLSEKIHYCEMTPEQAIYYETKKSEIRNAIAESIKEKGPEKSRFFIFSGLTKLRLIANHPAIIDKSYHYESGKFIEIKRSIEKIISENHKVLIFSQFVKYFNLLVDEFSANSLPYSLLTGKVAEKNRQEVIQHFQQKEDVRLFLISLKAGGLGLNLTEADYVLMLDPWWNPAIEKQAINRAHRIGQDKNVFMYKFITRNTVEEKILKLQQKKADLAGLFINDNNPLKSLSMEELHDLI